MTQLEMALAVGLVVAVLLIALFGLIIVELIHRHYDYVEEVRKKAIKKGVVL